MLPEKALALHKHCFAAIIEDSGLGMVGLAGVDASIEMTMAGAQWQDHFLLMPTGCLYESPSSALEEVWQRSGAADIVIVAVTFCGMFHCCMIRESGDHGELYEESLGIGLAGEERVRAHPFVI